jgi:hypothetical protein
VIFVIALLLVWALLAIGLARLSVPGWAAVALGFSGSVVAVSSMALDGTLLGAVLFSMAVLIVRRRYDLRLTSG